MPPRTKAAQRDAYNSLPMGRRKRIALIAHDNCKLDLLDWARYNVGTLSKHELFATGTTGTLLAAELGLEVTRFLSGPLGGDQQVGAGVAEGRIDFVLFFWIRSSRSRTTSTSRPCSASPSSTTSRWHATGLPPTSCCRAR